MISCDPYLKQESASKFIRLLTFNQSRPLLIHLSQPLILPFNQIKMRLLLSRQIEERFAASKQTSTTYLRKVELKNRLEILLKEKVPQLKCIHIFGSSANNLGTNKSDVDMYAELTYPASDHMRILTTIHDELRKLGSFRDFELIRAKFVPLVRFTSDTGIIVDLGTNNPNGVRSTHLLHCFERLDERVAPLAVIVKMWAKAKKINDPFRYTLSSYGYVLMVIHYLQCGCSPPVLPNLIAMMPQVFDVNSNISSLTANQELPYFKSSNTQSLGELLLGFFRYYNQEFNFDRDAISIRDGKRVSKSAIRGAFRDWETIGIQDPFNLLNVGRCTWKPWAFSKIKQELRNALNILEQGRNLHELV